MAAPACFALFTADPIPARLAAGLARFLVFRRHADGRVTVVGGVFPDEIDVYEAFVAELDPTLVRLERGRLYLTVANGEAVYVPVGQSRLRFCTRYGRLYRRLG